MADLSWGQGRALPGSKFFHFHAVFGQKNRLAHSLWELAPPSGSGIVRCKRCNAVADLGARGTRALLSPFLGGLSLHLNHLIASHMTNYDWPFGTLPFGLFGSNLDTRDLETYPRTYSGHF